MTRRQMCPSLQKMFLIQKLITSSLLLRSCMVGLYPQQVGFPLSPLHPPTNYCPACKSVFVKRSGPPFVASWGFVNEQTPGYSISLHLSQGRGCEKQGATLEKWAGVGVGVVGVGGGCAKIPALLPNTIQ